MSKNDPLGIVGRYISIPTRVGIGLVIDYWREHDQYIIRYRLLGEFVIRPLDDGRTYQAAVIPSDLYVTRTFIETVAGVVVHPEHKRVHRFPLEDGENQDENISTE